MKHEWALVIADLKEAHHTQKDINKMTLSQLKIHLKAATKKQVLRKIEYLSLTAIAAQSDGKSIKKTLAELEKTLHEADSG